MSDLVQRRPDGMPTSADERALRRMYAARVGMPHTYMDDGEAQGQEHGIVIDFMREPVADIAAKVLALEVARYKCRKPDALESQAAEIERLRKDAERYRWLRDGNGDFGWAVCEWGCEEGWWFRDARAADVVDAAIDAAKNNHE